VSELLVLIPILTLGFIISSRLSGPSNNYEILAYLPMGLFSAIGFVTLFELGIRTSPFGKMISASVLAAIIIGMLIISKGFNRLGFQLRYASIFVASMGLIILLIRNTGLVLLSPDSYAILANASYFRDSIPISFGSLPEVVKRGVTFPVLNGLMPRDSFLVTLAPLLNFALISQIIGGVYLFRKFLINAWAVTGLTLTFLLSFLSIYQVQKNFFYINTHTLVAGCLTSLAILGFTWRLRRPSRTEIYIASGIGIALSLCRAEGYLLFIVALIGIISISEIETKEIFHMCMLPLLGNVIWYSTVIFSFREGGPALSILVIDILLTAGIIALPSRYLKRYRDKLMQAAILIFGVTVVAIGAKHPTEFITGISKCVYNYYEFWGAPLFGMVALTTVSLFNHSKYPLSNYFGLFSLNIFLFSVFAKLSDGGAGKQIMICRVGWGDSLNRSFMHLMGLVLLSSIFILTEKNVRNSESQTSVTP